MSPPQARVVWEGWWWGAGVRMSWGRGQKVWLDFAMAIEVQLLLSGQLRVFQDYRIKT